MSAGYRRIAAGGLALGGGLFLSAGQAVVPAPMSPIIRIVLAPAPAPRFDATVVERPAEPSSRSGFVPQVRVELPQVTTPEALPAVAVVVADVEHLLTGSPADDPAPATSPDKRAPAWKADIAQIAASEVNTAFVPQLHEPGLVAGAPPSLAAKVDAMQVRPPALQLRENGRAALLAGAPTEMTVRIGDEAAGQVAFRMTDGGSIDVHLAGLLDIVADRLSPDEFARLRSSTAAESYVSADQLRSIGLTLRYDPVYDELHLSA